MQKRRRSAIITQDGFLDLPAQPLLAFDDEYGAPSLHGHMVVRGITHDAEIALAQQLCKEGLLQLIGKSGGSRVGLELRQRPDPNCTNSEFDFRNGTIAIPIQLLSLRAVRMRQNGVHDDLLRVLEDMHRERPVQIGRLAMVRPEDQLNRNEVLRAFTENQIAISARLQPEACVQEDGTIELPLEDMHYAFCEANFRTEEKRRALRFGKHGLSGMQEERYGLPEKIGEKEFFVGGIRISLGAFTAIIDRDTNHEGVVHLAARLLDGIQTTGIDVARQVELFNMQYEHVTSAGVKVRIRLYHANKEAQQFAGRIINQRTIAHGVSLSDTIELQRHPERIIAMMHAVSPSVGDGNPAGYFVGAGKAHKIQWVDNPSRTFQETHLQITAPKFAAGDPDYTSRSKYITMEPAHELSKLLGYVGQAQSHRNMYFQWGFPSPSTMAHMRQNGVGVFVAHDLRMGEDAYDQRPYFSNKLQRRVLESDGGEKCPVNTVFFTDKEFSAFQHLHAEGAKFLLVQHAMQDAFHEVPELPETVLEWHERGFWVKPEMREMIEQVDTLIAMYGSHVRGTDAVLEPQVARFALRMKRLFKNRGGFIHGKGPGVMYLADKIARELPEYAQRTEGFDDIEKPMASIGVGIDLEQSNQKINPHPHAQVDFGAQHRLVRQKHMNDRALFNIFNLGGAGTLEEIALSLCSQKLYKNILTPLIFVDPNGVSIEGKNFWKKLQAFIEDMSTCKEIFLPSNSDTTLISDAEMAQAKVNVQLLQGHMKNFIHVVDNYDDAAEIIEKFVGDPVGYYVNAGVCRNEFEMAFAGAIDVRKDTKFPMPHWLDGTAYGAMLQDNRWNTQPQEQIHTAASKLA